MKTRSGIPLCGDSVIASRREGTHVGSASEYHGAAWSRGSVVRLRLGKSRSKIAVGEFHAMNRREWMQNTGAVAIAAFAPSVTNKTYWPVTKLDCVFELSVITDEISQDFGHALEVASKEFGLGYVELRGLWNKNIVALDEKEVAEARKLLSQHDLKVTDIASPLFKVDWPGAPISKYSPKGSSYGANYSFAQQDEVLERAIGVANAFGTKKVRMFDFWRLDDDKPYRDAMDAKLSDAAEEAAKKDIVLLLENEYECNTATAPEAARTLSHVKARNFLLNWDPANAAMRGDKVFPEGYALLPKDRIGHAHLKDVKRNADGTYAWECMGRGIIDYVGQLRALMRDGYRGTMSLETHWNGAGNMEESSRQSMAGTKTLLREAGALK
jgi:L-ribulose-5-phosphate 3-epimerase